MKNIVKRAPLIAIIIAIITGALMVSGFNVAVSETNTESFCVSCHEMEINYEEYKDTVHYKNRTGVRATCPDCHVPKEFGPKMAAKIRAAKDVWHHLLGTIDNEEKYEAYRLTMAKVVWKQMEETDSRECRVCHTVESMAFEEQQGRAARKHKKMAETGKTCINCHKGVAHELPEDYDESEDS
ncbi:MAG: NapC/NirT family cytochrome c [Ectothiorhodospiraceae bacterium]|nr:NapC/NirT family cytochrome c [Ectothiorhodospiraceae bacterium]